MKTIIVEPVQSKTVLLSELSGKEIIVYATANKSVCILTAHKRRQPYEAAFGFVNIVNPIGGMVFGSESWFDSIQLAIKAGRTLRVFEDQTDFFSAASKGQI